MSDRPFTAQDWRAGRLPPWIRRTSVGRSEMCACGGWISVVHDEPVAIEEAVSRHNAMPRHTAWRLGVRLG